MNIKILDSHLREFLKTKATPAEIAKNLSLTSLSVERIEKINGDFLYEMEITTNRPDLFSVTGVAREASAVLPQFGIPAEFIFPKLKKPQGNFTKFPIKIENNPKLVNRICAVVMEVTIEKSPEIVSKRLEAADIRSLNNVIDVTNYVMLTLGHPTHVFDFDRLNTKKLVIKEARKGEKITTLDGKNHMLHGGEILAADENNKIVDLLGIMGLENSVVTENTKKILFFIDNNEKTKIRKASMQLAIRTEAATLNEKGIDPNLSMEAMLYGIELFQKNASAVQICEILDIYENKPESKNVSVSFEKIDKVIGIKVDKKKSVNALVALGFLVTEERNGIKVSIPSYRINDVSNEEDIVEEIARIYGYFNLPSILPPNSDANKIFLFANKFYFEQRVKKAMKYWGFTETYTYSFVSEDMFEGPTTEAVKVENPLNEDFVYMRNSLIPSLLKVVSDNKDANDIKIFEIANTYLKKEKGLPKELLTFSGVLKKDNASFYEVKGVIEQIFEDLNIKSFNFKKSSISSLGASVFIEKDYLGEIEVLDNNLINFELNFELLLKYANTQREFTEFAKFPPVIQDLTVTSKENVATEDIINTMGAQSDLVKEVSLIDEYENSKTFRLTFQDPQKNLTKVEVAEIREKIIASLKKSFSIEIR